MKVEFSENEYNIVKALIDNYYYSLCGDIENEEHTSELLKFNLVNFKFEDIKDKFNKPYTINNDIVIPNFGYNSKDTFGGFLKEHYYTNIMNERKY
jgi:hypothetical protein